MAKLYDMAAFAMAHGFDTLVRGEAVIVSIPWFNSSTGESGSEAIECKTWSQLRIALGY